MANPTCDKDTLVSAANCFFNFSAHDRAALQIYFDSLQLTAIGGTAYTLGSGGTLSLASICYRDFQSPFQPATPYELAIAYANAVSAGAAPASTPDTMATAIACLNPFPDADLTAMQLQLYCALGRAKAYPQ